MTLYPIGYRDELVTLEVLELVHGDRMHPEFRRRLFAYLEHKGGALGIGGGFRTVQPDRPGFAPDGKSFHQAQRFASGVVGYAAVDLVEPDGPDGNNWHDGVEWEDTADAPEWGLHTFIMSPEEPWHIQPIEVRGWQTWVDAGRPDPTPWQLPNQGDPDMPRYIVVPPASEGPKAPWLFVEGPHVRYATGRDVTAAAGYTPPPHYTPPLEQYRNMRKSVGL